MRFAVFALATVSILSGVSAYADRMTQPAPQVQEMAAAPQVQEIPAAPLASLEGLVPGVGSSARLMDVQTAPPASPPVTPTAVTPEPSSVVLLATGLIGVSGMLWRRRPLAR